MTLDTQNSIAAHLRSVAALEGVAIHTSSSELEIPGDASAIVVSCDTAESPVAGLYRATVQISLSTPCLLPDALETHRTLASILRPAVNLDSVSTKFPAHLAYSGRHLTTWSESREDERFLTTAELVVGVREI
jgi:hypothetical protein